MSPDSQPEFITDELRSAVVEAIRHARIKIRWKPGKDVKHLAKRIRLGHLPPEATLTEYESIITSVLNNDKAELYLFFYGSTSYPTLVTTIESQSWLVMIGLNGIMETAFPPDDLENYLSDPAYVYLGLLEVLEL